MLAVLAFDRREVPLVTKLAEWIVELGGVKTHSLLLVPSRRTSREGLESPLIETFQKAFGSVEVFNPAGEDEYGWPDSANFAWRQVVNHVTYNLGDCPFFWFEADSVPLVPDWLDQIEAEFTQAGKPFMGGYVQIDNIPPHLTGISVYHYTTRHCPMYGVVQYQQGYSSPQVAWDVALARWILPMAHITDLIQHEWKPEPFENLESLVRLNPKAVIYHQCKDGSLIDRFLELRRGVVGSTLMLTLSTPKGISTPYPSNTVFTYFSPLESIDGEEQRMLISLWEYSWRKYGWNPVALSEDDIKDSATSGVFASLPSCNPAGYDRACFDRWLAMAGVGGGFMSDYDVMNLGLKPFEVPERLTVYQIENPCPSFVGGSGEEFHRMALLFAKKAASMAEVVDDLSLHISDQNAIQKMPKEYEHRKLVTAHGKPGWWNSRLIHFSNSTMEGKQPRSSWIPHLLYAREPK